MKQSSYSNLYQIIDKCLLYPNAKCCDFQTKVFKEPLQLTVIECCKIMYASDLNHTIQLHVFDKNVQTSEEISLKTQPFNSMASNYYRKLDSGKFNIWEAYNCNIPQLLNSEVVEYPSPYSPQFYFGSTFNELKSMKKQRMDEDVKLIVSMNNKTIKIQEWKIRIVNISETGWYAPVLEALRYRMERKSFQENFKNVNLILYQPKVKQTMEAMWQADLKQMKFGKTPERYGFYYFTMQEKKSTFSSTNIYQWDKEGQWLKFNKEKKHFYVPFGTQLQETLSLKEELGKDNVINQQQVKDKYIRLNYKELFNNKDDTGNRQIRDLRQNLWSSDEDSSQPQLQQDNILQPMVDQNDEEFQESEDEDLLKNTYIKYLKQQTQKML